MKKKMLVFAIIGCLAIGRAEPKNVKSSEPYRTCSGEFKINGDSYTITLHDVSWWTCVKFKVASWFN